MNEVNKSRRFI